MTDPRRFWDKVATGTPDECWEWQGARRAGKNENYGRYVADGRRSAPVVKVAHRVVWELAYGPIPEGMKVLHRCDNPPCVNPAHLYLGTQADNVADKVARGRQARGDLCIRRAWRQSIDRPRK